MSDASTREDNLLIIRRGGAAELEAPKGGVWKIAYADFMTAMMAFFLVMWLINATSESTKTGVANYFNPIKFSEGRQGQLKGLYDPAEDEGYQTEAGEVDGQTEEPHGEAADDHSAKAEKENAPAASNRNARFTEDALFRDPYAVLAAIAAEADGTSSLTATGQGGDPGAPGGGEFLSSKTYGDPFDPASWQSAAAPAAEAQQAPAEPFSAKAVAGDKTVPATGPDALGGAKNGGAGDADIPTDSGKAASDKSGRATPIRDGYGHGEGKNDGDGGAEPATSPLSEQLAAAIQAGSKPMPNVTVESAEGGVLISLADQVDFGMFAIGSAEPLPETIAVMEKIAEMLQKVPGRVIIRGHTDSRPFLSGDYDNWRLSSARAHMAYHMLVRGGLDETRVQRIEGYADRDPKLPENPEGAENRRIDILIQEVAQ